MDSELFISFLEHFDTYLTEKKINRPARLFVDGPSTHMSLPAANLFREQYHFLLLVAKCHTCSAGM
jgi:hypothetical protein